MRTLVLFLLGLTVGGVLFALFWRSAEVDLTVPPLPGDLGRMDPAVAKLIRLTHSGLAREPGQADRWLQMAMVYDANELHDHAVDCYETARQYRVLR